MPYNSSEFPNFSNPSLPDVLGELLCTSDPDLAKRVAEQIFDSTQFTFSRVIPYTEKSTALELAKGIAEDLGDEANFLKDNGIDL